MDPSSNRGVALVAIHPEYAEAIVSGTKKVEFRRSRFARDVHTVVIYATKPVGKVIATFEVAEIDEGSPTALWRRHREHGGISRQRFRNYFAGAERGYAIVVGRVNQLPEPVSLKRLGRDLTPPQSFRYVKPEVVEPLVA